MKSAWRDGLRAWDQQWLNGLLLGTYRALKSIRFWIKNYFFISGLPRNSSRLFHHSARLDFFRSAQYFLQVNRIDGLYVEFGVHEANTFRMALNTLGLYGRPNRVSKFFAFDSFQGMPNPEGIDNQKIWRRGLNTTSETDFRKMVRRDLHRTTIVAGFFEDIVQDFDWPTSEPIALAYIDCDYYSSTKACLEIIEPKLRHGSLIAFDDWNCFYGDPQRGQKRAFDEFFKENSRFFFAEFRSIATGGQSFIALEIDKLGQPIL